MDIINQNKHNIILVYTDKDVFIGLVHPHVVSRLVFIFRAQMKIYRAHHIW